MNLLRHIIILLALPLYSISADLSGYPNISLEPTTNHAPVRQSVPSFIQVLMDTPRALPLLQLGEIIVNNPLVLKKYQLLLIGVASYGIEEYITRSFGDILYVEPSQIPTLRFMQNIARLGIYFLNFTRPFRYGLAWEYITSLAKKNITENMQQNTVQHPYTTCENHHILHRACAEKLIHNICPLCRSSNLSSTPLNSIIKSAPRQLDDTCVICLEETAIDTTTAQNTLKQLISSKRKQLKAQRKLNRYTTTSKNNQIKLNQLSDCYKNITAKSSK